MQASRDYDNTRYRLIAYGKWPHRVDAEPARAHITMLSAHGIGWERAAKLAGIPVARVSRLLYGSSGHPPTRTLTPDTEAKILAVRPDLANMADRARVDATGTRRRMQALVAIGWPRKVLAQRMGMDDSNFGNALRGNLVLASTARAARDLYMQLWNVVPESDGVTPSVAERSRRHAMRQGWAPPAAWDDFDNPDEMPSEWRRTADRYRAEDLIEDAKYITRTTGVTDKYLLAERLGVKVNTLEKARERIATRSKAGAA